MKVKSKELYIFSIIALLFFGAFWVLQYAPDTYSVFTNDLAHTVKHFLSCGRFVTGAAAYFAMGILKLGNKGTYILSYIFAMVCLVASLYRLNNLIKKDVKNDIISMLISTLILINPFSIELYMYVEKGIMVLSVLLCVLAVEQIDKFFQGNKKAIIWGLFFMLVANFCYQGTVGLFVAISLIYIIKYSKNIKEFIINNVVVMLVYGIPALINFLSVRFLFSNERINGKIILSESIYKMIAGTKLMIIDTYGLLPKYLFLAVIIVLLGFIIYKSKAKKLLSALYLIAGTLFVTVAPQILQDTNSIWFVARSSYSMAAIIGILALYIFMKFEVTKIEKNSIEAILVIFLLIQFASFAVYTIDNYIGNYMDKTITLEINDMIKKYEEETGNVIDSVAFYTDEAIQYNYSDLKSSGDMNVRAYAPDWCRTRILKLYTGREFKVVESDAKQQEEFSNNNWNSFNEEQVKFKDNVMHLCIF